jgi:hypothetical protein
LQEQAASDLLSLMDLTDASGAVGDRALCGWRVRTAVSLPELPPWRGDDRHPDICIGIGRVPGTLDDVIATGPFLQAAQDGTFRFEVAAVARYLVTGGREVTIDPRVPAQDPAVRLFLLGNVLALLCWQRGLLPVHASCVAINGQAVMFAGESGSGKSVVAAALASNGYLVVADDICVIDWRQPGPRVLPSVARLTLWPRALRALGLAPRPHGRVRAELEKYAVSQTISPDSHLPIAAIYYLRPASSVGAFTPLAGIDALMRLQRAVHGVRPALYSIGPHGLFQATSRVAAVTQQFELTAGDHVGKTLSLAAHVEARHTPAA